MLIASSPPEALAWADRLYAPLRNQSCEGVRWQAREALEAYRAVDRRYPHAPTAHVGAARCLFRLGLYRESVKEYLAAKGARDELASAIDYAQMAALVQRQLPKGHSVRHLARISRDEWVAATGLRFADSVWFFFRDVSLRPFRREGNEAVASGKAVAIETHGRWCWEFSLFKPAAMKRSFFLQTTYLAGDTLPNEVYIAQCDEKGVRLSPGLRSKAGTRVWFARGQAWIGVTPTFKVWWMDIYGWKGGRFSFASHRWPSEYRGDYDDLREDSGRDYSMWARYAAQLTLQRRRREAIAAWRRAERYALGEARETAGGLAPHEGRYVDWGYFGDPGENAKQIRQRIEWLRRRDWNHWLLYRPYDRDLQVPPYRLGNAYGPEED